MARTTITQVSDDLDGSKDAEEVSFSFDGVDYTIDLSKKNRAALEKVLKPYLDVATRQTGRSSSRQRRTATSKRSTRRTGPDLAAVREWAKANDIAVSERGRVAQTVLDQYTEANN